MASTKVLGQVCAAGGGRKGMNKVKMALKRGEGPGPVEPIGQFRKSASPLPEMENPGCVE